MRFVESKGKMTGVWRKVGEKMIERYYVYKKTEDKVDGNVLCLMYF